MDNRSQNQSHYWVCVRNKQGRVIWKFESEHRKSDGIVLALLKHRDINSVVRHSYPRGEVTFRLGGDMICRAIIGVHDTVKNPNAVERWFRFCDKKEFNMMKKIFTNQKLHLYNFQSRGDRYHEWWMVVVDSEVDNGKNKKKL